MELNDLKNILNLAASQNQEGTPEISLKSGHAYDPFQQIKKRCLWILLFFAGTTVLFFPFLWEKNNGLFGILYGILSIESVISLTGYWQIRMLEQSGGNIKENLVQRIRRLQSIFRSYIFLNASLYILLAFVLEYMIMKSFSSVSGLEKIAFPIRLLIYLVFIVFQYLQKQWSYKKNYGSYLSSMIQLLSQTHEN